jgi:folate-dependent tRNA-U54 methylase TrmFO/GidA
MNVKVVSLTDMHPTTFYANMYRYGLLTRNTFMQKPIALLNE